MSATVSAPPTPRLGVIRTATLRGVASAGGFTFTVTFFGGVRVRLRALRCLRLMRASSSTRRLPRAAPRPRACTVLPRDRTGTATSSWSILASLLGRPAFHGIVDAGRHRGNRPGRARAILAPTRHDRQRDANPEHPARLRYVPGVDIASISGCRHAPISLHHLGLSASLRWLRALLFAVRPCSLSASA